MGLVIRRVTIPVPRSISTHLLKLAVRLRILDPPPLGSPPRSPREDPDTLPSPNPSAPPVEEDSLDKTTQVASPEPVWDRRLQLVLDLRTAPVVGCIFLLATTVIDGGVVRLGIVGEDGVRPYDVLVLFISLVSPFSAWTFSSPSLTLPLSPTPLSGLHLDRP